MSKTETTLRPATIAEIERLWRARWTGPRIVTQSRLFRPVDVEGLVAVDASGELRGLITWRLDGEAAELVTLDALEPRRGLGTRLVETAEQTLRDRGAARLSFGIAADDLPTLGFFLRRGYRLMRVHLDALEPHPGGERPSRDLWELHKALVPGGDPSTRRLVSSGSPYEPTIGFSRAVRVGELVAVSGTAPLGEDGTLVGPGDLYLQTHRCLEIIRLALGRAGARLTDVVRTRIYLTDTTRWSEAARAHGEIFGDIRPASTFVKVAGLLDPEWLVEIEADALIARH